MVNLRVIVLQTGQETDFVLVSCSGLGIEPSRREQVLKAKRAGEDSLRRSGLGYTIVRPGPLQVKFPLLLKDKKCD